MSIIWYVYHIILWAYFMCLFITQIYWFIITFTELLSNSKTEQPKFKCFIDLYIFMIWLSTIVLNNKLLSLTLKLWKIMKDTINLFLPQKTNFLTHRLPRNCFTYCVQRVWLASSTIMHGFLAKSFAIFLVLVSVASRAMVVPTGNWCPILIYGVSK